MHSDHSFFSSGMKSCVKYIPKYTSVSQGSTNLFAHDRNFPIGLYVIKIKLIGWLVTRKTQINEI